MLFTAIDYLNFSFIFNTKAFHLNLIKNALLGVVIKLLRIKSGKEFSQLDINLCKLIKFKMKLVKPEIDFKP